VFPELLEHATTLMMDPFGNYLIQKLLDRCSEEQRLQVHARARAAGAAPAVAASLGSEAPARWPPPCMVVAWGTVT
jgi:hypothetical protein